MRAVGSSVPAVPLAPSPNQRRTQERRGSPRSAYIRCSAAPVY
jgi:hypothetical protein